VRNRYFREWSHAAQPDGNPDSIVWYGAASIAAATRAVEQGRADFTFSVAPGKLTALEIEHPDQLYLNPSFFVEYIALNTHRVPNVAAVVRDLGFRATARLMALTDHAYLVPTVNLDNVEIVSSRLRHYGFNPAEDFLADQAWIH
jgi:ABC-type transport system substrate-binding protein